MTVTTQTFRPTALAGQTYMRRYGSSDPLRAVGNVSKLDETVTEDVKTLKDYTKPGGGAWSTLRRISDMTLAATMHDIDSKVLAMVRYGTESAVPSGTVTIEAHTARTGGLCLFGHVNATSVVVTDTAGAWAGETAVALGAFVKDATHLYEATTAGTTAASEPTWPTGGSTVTDGTVVWTDRGVFAAVADTDYVVRAEGILILDGGIPDGCPINIAYSYAAYDAVEMLTGSPLEYEVVFAGLNEANSSSPVRLQYYRCQVSAAKTISWIGDDFAALAVELKVMADTTVTGSGKSQYCQVQMV